MGALVYMIRAPAVLCENFIMQPVALKLSGFEDNEVKLSGIILESVKINNIQPKIITFRVVADTAQKYDIILGRLYTEALDVNKRSYIENNCKGK